MFNRGPHWNQASWSHTYYHQYMQQHTQLTQWLQQVHQNASTQHHCAHHCCSVPQNSGHNCCGVPKRHCAGRNYCPVPLVNMGHAPAVNMGHVPAVNVGHVPAVNMGHVPAVNMGHAYPPAYHYPAVDHTGAGYSQETYVRQAHGKGLIIEDDSEDSDVGDEAEDSEGELIFNVDAILEMRATREISDRDSEDSFELLDSVKDNMQEYIEMDAYGNVQRMSGKLKSVNMQEEEENHKGWLKMTYGKKASSIGGKEAVMGVQFDHLYDLTQPSLWPVLPLLL